MLPPAACQPCVGNCSNLLPLLSIPTRRCRRRARMIRCCQMSRVTEHLPFVFRAPTLHKPLCTFGLQPNFEGSQPRRGTMHNATPYNPIPTFLEHPCVPAQNEQRQRGDPE